jgi:dihydroorotase
MSERTTLIRGGHVVDPSASIDARLDILVREGRIIEVAPKIDKGRANRTIKAKGLIVAPAFIDLHTHLREPGGETSETIATGARAAAMGGFARIFCMPNTSPVCDSPVAVKQVLDRAREACGVRVYPVASVSRGMSGEKLTDFGALLRDGAGAFSDDGLPVANAEVMRSALECTRDIGAVIFDHCEDLSLTGAGVMHEGEVALRLGLKGIPRISETAIVLRDCALSLATGGRLHVCHVSNSESVEAVRHFKSRGAPVTAEVSPHHLLFTHERIGEYDTHAKMKPPLCEESDRQALIEALEDGTIDCIATDHAPHAPALKADTFDHAPFGIIGMETAFASLHTVFVTTGRWSLAFLIEKMTAAPARVMAREAGENPWGTLRVGAEADVVLLDVEQEYEMSLEHLGSRSRNCPWLGQRLRGRAVCTMVGGRVIHVEADRIAGVAATA